MTTIITKNSSTASSVPSAAQLVQGELAVNVTDRRLFTENSSGSVVELGTNPSSLTLPNGTANGVAYLNGSKVLTSGSALTFDGTNLGVGTSSPDKRLDVLTGTADTDIAAFSGASTGRGLVISTFTNSATTDAGVDFDAISGSGVFSFSTGTSERMRLTSTGLGIGTSSPESQLHIYQPSGQTGFRITRLSTLAAGASLSLTVDSAGARVNGYGNLQFYTAAIGGTVAERMRIDSSGNVGIGTSSPNASAILDAQSTTKGVRMPNMTTTQKNAIASPAAGLMVFDTTLAKLCVYSGAAWETITSI